MLQGRRAALAASAGQGSLLVCYRPLAPPRYSYLLREIGASTYHDMAVARAAFGFAWPRNETLAYHAQPPRDPIFGPAHCDSYTTAMSASARAITGPATRLPANAPGRNEKVSRRR